MDIAGDVIKDWTPCQANTFEKLSKVLNLKSGGWEKESVLWVGFLLFVFIVKLD